LSGAAEDHYLAGNFSEAFALYEHLGAAAELTSDNLARWSTALALALSEDGLTRPPAGDVAERLAARTAAVLSGIEQPLTRRAINGLLAERAGQHLDAGRAYAGALGEVWRLPPADQRRTVVADLRRRVIERLRARHSADRRRHRNGTWSIALPDVWKRCQTEHIDVYAHNDLVAERIAEAAEYHFAGLSEWLGAAGGNGWEPDCEVRVYASTEELQRATNAEDGTQALTETLAQGNRVLLRRMNVWQGDPWLLSSTLPRELTHVLLADPRYDGKLPLALEEGLAVQAEPPARRLQFRRLLGAEAPDAGQLLSMKRIPEDKLGFFADCDALTRFLLQHAGATTADGSVHSAIAAVRRPFRDGYTPRWWKVLGWDSEEVMSRDWVAWYAARRDPPRMPLMILAPPSGRTPSGGD
jgi:hypothetical protein